MIFKVFKHFFECREGISIMVTEFKSLSAQELEQKKAQLTQEYEAYCAKNLKLDMSRGKPGKDQLDLSMDLLNVLDEHADCTDENGMDCRNYGVPAGIPECRKLFAELFEVEPQNIIVGGNSSLNLMFDYVSQCMTHGVDAQHEPWIRQGKVKFLCPVPGYDRHFAVLEYFGIEMINVPMDDNGPNMDMVEQLIADPLVKGIYCVPKYSNPGGVTYSDEVVRRLAAMKPAAEDFRILWDNAYCVHEISDTPDELLNLYDECVKAGCPDRPVMFASTSKITFPGAGVSAIAASENNVQAILHRMSFQTIGHDKLNELRHVRYFKNLDGIKAHMQKHAALIRPKFAAVNQILTDELSGLGIADWKLPNGGYFISFNVMPGCAKRVVALCKQAGVTLTGAGASFPYGKDPDDTNIRIAPTLPPVHELETATKLLALCTKLAAVEKLLAQA